jgi:HAAS domain-containing protein
VTIDAYLAELERRLPRIARLRALSEIREHLRDAAARHRSAGRSPFDAEAAATREFGPVADVARRFSSELAVRETRIVSVLSLVAVAFFVFPIYVVPENTLPPAPWTEKPPDIALLQGVAITLWLLGGVLASASVVLAWSRWLRFALLALLGAVGGIAGSTAVSAVLVQRWFAFTPATPNWALAAPLAFACVVVCSAAALWARSSRPRLVLQD